MIRGFRQGNLVLTVETEFVLDETWKMFLIAKLDTEKIQNKNEGKRQICPFLATVITQSDIWQFCPLMEFLLEQKFHWIQRIQGIW